MPTPKNVVNNTAVSNGNPDIGSSMSGESMDNSQMSVRANSMIQNAMRYKSATRLNLKSATGHRQE
jgi:hypothetical protein